MHRQRSTGSTERGCNSQNTSRREQEEAKKQKELDEAEAEEKAYEQAKEYMENYRIRLQESMQAAGNKYIIGR